jgi:hypothetical protein
MARDIDGWFSVTRRIFDPRPDRNDFAGDGDLIVVWLTLMAWALKVPGQTKLGRQRVTLARGELSLSQNDLEALTGKSRKVIRRCLGYLRESGRIELTSSPHGSIVTVVNFEEYQWTPKAAARKGGANGQGSGGAGAQGAQGDDAEEGPTQGQGVAGDNAKTWKKGPTLGDAPPLGDAPSEASLPGSGPTQGQRRANGGPHKEHSDTETRDNPPKPPKGGGVVKPLSARARGQKAAAVVERAIAAYNSHDPAKTKDEQQAAAVAMIGAREFKLLTLRHRGSWHVFMDWLVGRCQKMPLGIVEKQLRTTVAGLLAEADEWAAAAAKPEVRTDATGASSGA